jgi:hypothetical protein
MERKELVKIYGREREREGVGRGVVLQAIGSDRPVSGLFCRTWASSLASVSIKKTF